MNGYRPQTFSTRRALHGWFAGAPGRLILDAEIAQLNRTLPDLFGYYLLQVGRLADADLLAMSRVMHRIVVEIDDEAQCIGYPTIRGSSTMLPVDSDSVDVVLMPHILEFETRPHEALREAFRVLVPEGTLIITGFNPWSFMGAWRLFRGSRGGVPWSGHFLGLNRLKDWLAVLGFDVRHPRMCFFKPPFHNERLLKRLDFLEVAGGRALPYFAGAYLIVAVKRITTLTPIRPRWALRRRLAGVGLAGPAARVRRRERLG